MPTSFPPTSGLVSINGFFSMRFMMRPADVTALPTSGPNAEISPAISALKTTAPNTLEIEKPQIL